MFFTAFVLCILKLFKLKKQKAKQYTQNHTAKLQNFHLSWVSLIRLWITRPRAPLLGLAKSIYYPNYMSDMKMIYGTLKEKNLLIINKFYNYYF